MKSSYIWFWYLCSRELWTDVLWNDVLSWMAAEVVFKCKAMSSVPCGPRWDIARLFFYFILEFFFLGMQVLEWNGIPLTSKTYEEVQSIISQQNGEAEICVRPWVFPHLFVLKVFTPAGRVKKYCSEYLCFRLGSPVVHFFFLYWFISL